jgi:hypothetical protein
MYELIAGPARAIVPAIVAWLVGRGYIPIGAAAEVVAAVLAVGAAAWSLYEKRPEAKIANVAAMAGTTVSRNGDIITIMEPALAKAAKEAATPA